VKHTAKTLIFLLIIASHPVLAQEETQHIFENNRPVEWSLFLAPEAKYSSLYGIGTIYGGLKGALLFNHHYAFGISFGGFLTETVTYGPGSQGDTTGLNTVMMYGGFYLDYVTTFNAPVQISFPTVIGGGGVLLLEKMPKNPISGIVDEKLVEGGVYFVLEPAINLEVNLSRVVRIGIGGGYRFIINSDLERFSNKDLSAPSINFNIKFGIY
jgi:hypothetical protein